MIANDTHVSAREAHKARSDGPPVLPDADPPITPRPERLAPGLLLLVALNVLVFTTSAAPPELEAAILPADLAALTWLRVRLRVRYG